ncbi:MULTISPECIES: ABC transporter family substrate-binding protein [Prauserella salsuginis group]|uniref:ABC transporter family substrate-binding protein n=1 Tax=Prauserella salsuginis TaxID=387889 RepID=A0ABW6GAY8_9PSEU|nr:MULTISPECIES: ABC transporter family substrate-binding protein [Prauserella salsuginis group]MCR3722367.1 ABC-type transport system, substrate-binding protein [Prauserella flava]MCR3736809.1 ABC-type transport system, substrate-binding protein [Prauserella salsuginis]
MRAIIGGRAGRKPAVLVFALVALLVTACTNMPPPPVVSSPVAATSTAAPGDSSDIAVAVDSIGGGYNPHNLADQSTTTQALATMLLPSVFREGDDGGRVLDERLMKSAEVTAHDPFTVSYRIRPDASWSDGAPIAVEDFVYLHEAMTSQPGVVGDAGYRLISEIRPADGGKRVDVEFSEPYPGWRTLFDHLLPQHLMKDVPGGWQNALSDSFPAYGGPFAITTIDSARGEIVLERNERYWENPAAVDRVVLRRADPSALAGALGSGTDQLAVVGTDETVRQRLDGLGDDVSVSEVPRPYVVSTLLRPVATLADDQVREAVEALIDRDKLIEAGAEGGPSGYERAGAHVRPPSDDDYRATLQADSSPRRPQPRKARMLLEEAGYERVAGTWTRDGQPLSLALAAPGERQPFKAVADELTRQLVESGIEVRDATPQAPRELFNRLLAPGENSDGAVQVDMAVVGRPVSGDPASSLASSYGCAPLVTGGSSGGDEDEDGSGAGNTDESSESADGRTEESEPGDSGDGSGSGESETGESGGSTGDASDSDTGSNETETAQSDDSDGDPIRPANPAGYCDPELQSIIVDALTGSKPLDEALRTVEPALWDAGVTIPLFQPTDTVAVTADVEGVRASPMPAGPFASAVEWSRGEK